MTVTKRIVSILVPLVILLFVQKIAVGQCSPLTNIIESDVPESIKVQKLDSLFLILEKNRDFSLAECYHDLGNMWYYRNWKKTHSAIELENAIFYTKKAAQLKNELVGDNSESYFQSLYNLAFFYKLDGSIYKSIDTFENLILTADNHRFAQYAMEDIGKIFLEAGDFNKATEYFSELAEYYKKSMEWNDELAMHILLADTHGTMDYNKHKSTIEYHLRQADSIIKSQKLESSFEANQTKIIRGNLRLTMEDFENAVDQYSSINKEVFTNSEMARMYNNLSVCQLKLGDISNSQNNLLKSIELDSAFSLPYENLGDLYLEKEEFNKGMVHYQNAIHLLLGKNRNSSITHLPTIDEISLTVDKLPLLNHLTTKANGWIKYYEFDQKKEHLVHSLETYTLADQLVDLIRYESTEYQSKLYWREKGASLYMKAVEVCHLLNKPELASHFMERNKALLLLEDLTNEEAKEIAKLPNKAAEREFNLKRAIFLAENNLQEASDESNKAVLALKDTIRESKYRYGQFVDSLNESYPDYAKFKKRAAVLSFTDLKTNYVSNNKAVLHYILNEEQGYGLLTLPDTTLLFQISDIPKLNKEVETLIAALSDGVSDINMFRKVSNSVFGQLLPNNIYDKIKGKQLLIIPDYTLQRVPFEALVVNNKAELKYLIEEVEICYAYSMSLLNQTKGKEKNPPNELVAFAPVQFDKMGLPQLYFSENEITSIAELYPGNIFVNGKASKASFIDNVGQHKIVHLATHADIGDGENPWIAFSDSKMYLKEIYATRNQADMVVLSACNTSNGELKRGEGVMSLARGFFYSGAKSVVSTLWPVADEAGKDILIDFYKHLDQGDSKSEALQKAKLDYLKATEEVELKHPYYWAGFILVGDNAPMVEIPYGYWVLLGIGILVLLFLLLKGKLVKGIQ